MVEEPAAENRQDPCHQFSTSAFSRLACPPRPSPSTSSAMAAMERSPRRLQLPFIYFFLLNLVATTHALHFYLDGASSTPKCFYEELPKDTMVVGTHLFINPRCRSRETDSISSCKKKKAITQPCNTPPKPPSTKTILHWRSRSPSTKPLTTTTASSTLAAPRLANSLSPLLMPAITAFASLLPATIREVG